MPPSMTAKPSVLRRGLRALGFLVLGFAFGVLVEVLGLVLVALLHSPRNHVEPHQAFGIHYALGGLGFAYGAVPFTSQRRLWFAGVAVLLLLAWIVTYSVFEIQIGG